MADVLNNFHLDKRGAKKEISKLISCAAPFSKSSTVFSENHKKLAFLAKICMFCSKKLSVTVIIRSLKPEFNITRQN